MEKQALINVFTGNHQEVIDYMQSLTDDQFTSGKEGKWTAGQQFQHIYLTLLPFPKILPSKEYIREKFGKINRERWDTDTLIEKYYQTSRQAPAEYVPEQVGPEQKAKITTEIQAILQTIQQLLNNYTEEELNTLVLPHPLLGNLCLTEMFTLLSYHASHHLRQIIVNLEEGTKATN